jgi:XapX domain-containing protein
MNWKFTVGLLLGFAIGLGCCWAGIPSPAPPVLVGALLVFSMTLGYVITDSHLAKRKVSHVNESDGTTRSH